MANIASYPGQKRRGEPTRSFGVELAGLGLQVRGHGLGGLGLGRRLGFGPVSPRAVGVDEHLVIPEPVGVGEEQV